MNSVDLKLVNFEQALRLQSLGFTSNCETRYAAKDCYTNEDYSVDYKKGELVAVCDNLCASDTIQAPTLEEVKHWFRTNFKIFIDVESEPALDADGNVIDIYYDCCIRQYDKKEQSEESVYLSDVCKPTFVGIDYNETLSQGIDYAMSIVVYKSFNISVRDYQELLIHDSHVDYETLKELNELSTKLREQYNIKIDLSAITK